MSEGWENRIVRVGEVEPASLRANARNWRVHPAAQKEAMEDVLGEVGWVQGVIVNQTTGNLLDGHLRLERAIARKQPTMPVIYVDVTEEEEARILATLDPMSALAGLNQERWDALRQEAQTKRGSLRALLGLPLFEQAGTEAIRQEEARPTHDHGKDIAREEAGDDEDSRWAEDDPYAGTSMKLIQFNMRVEEYDPIIDQLEVIGYREGLETNADVVLWLLKTYQPGEASA